MPTIELDDLTYQKLLALAEGRDLSTEIYSLLVAAENSPTPFARPGKYYDSDKYKRTATADRRSS